MISSQKILEHELKTISKLQERIDFLNKKSNSLSYYRLAVIIAGVIFSFIGFNYANTWTGLGILLIAFIIFGILATIHSRVIFSINKVNKFIKLKQVRIARINLDWNSMPQWKKEDRDSHHPFEIDLDITGNYSLLRLLNNTFSKEGFEKLKNLLLYPLTDYKELINRQNIIRELIPFDSFREKLFLRFSYLKQNEFEGTSLLNWLKQDSHTRISPFAFILYCLISVFNITFFILAYNDIFPSVWVIGYLSILILYGSQEKKMKKIIGPSELIFDEYLKLAKILELISKTNLKDSPDLKNYLQIFHDENENPVHINKKINALINLLSFRENAIFRFLINSVLPYDIYLSIQLAKQKEILKNYLPAWLDKLYDFEMLNSLAEFGYINPEYTFPVILNNNSVNQNKTSYFTSKEISHPLIPYENRISNDFSLTKQNEIIIITGSNMSGKSTFLKTIGINLCLAFSGAPVAAKKFETSIFRIHTCIKITDDLNEGLSYFYAEVKRLKAIYDAISETNTVPLFFLIDEIFKGTNNRERLIGSTEYIKSLIGKNGCGMISTHDLELVNLGKEFDIITNMHFKEHIVEDKMVFDYKLNEGPCPTTNALRIMKLGGLNIEV